MSDVMPEEIAMTMKPLTRLDKFPLFNDGHVTYLEHLGSDSGIASDARVSYKGCDSLEMTDEEYSKDEALLRTLLRSSHSSPFEGTLIKWMMRIPLDVWQQFERHRTFRYCHVNMFSTRYRKAINSTLTTDPMQWRLQAKDNKQGSAGFVSEWTPEIRVTVTKYPHGEEKVVINTPGEFLTHREQELQELAREVYEERLGLGVAREQARKDLPLSTYTEVVVSCDVWNLMHFFMLRRKPDAQLEIRELANSLYENIFKPLFPATAQAFEDYRFNAISLSATEIKVICGQLELEDIKSKREQDDCRLKMEQIGVEPND